jgi:cardiolipin synthase
MYTWTDDRIGRRLAEAVRDRARAGISVYVLVDAFGSLGSEDLMASLEQSGAEVRWYQPLAPWAPAWDPNRRNHRKLILVDGAIGFTGGMNISEVYTSEFRGEHAWRDMTVSVQGPAVREMARIFLSTWLRCEGTAGAMGAILSGRREKGKAGVQVVGGGGWRGRRTLRGYYLTLIRLAHERIFLANAYFAPEPSLRRALCRAARRGVRVELLLPGTSDVPIVRWAGRASYTRLLEAGATIREMRGAVLHAKVAVFDDEIVLAGSANLDYRSFRHNLEIAVNVFDREFARKVLESFASDFTRAKEIRREDWRARSKLARVLERLAAMWSYWL